MTKQEIVDRIGIRHKEFIDFMLALNDRDFMYLPEGKWNAGQQLDHIIRAVSPLATGLRLPKFIVRLVFGKANRPSKTYEELVQKYLAKLEDGGKARGRFIPKQIKFNEKEKYTKQLLALVAELKKNINNYSEDQLDNYILPHPLLGKVTMREMMYFTIYHAEHHLTQAKKNILG
jgi:hypothetical protein